MSSESARKQILALVYHYHKEKGHKNVLRAYD